MKLAGIFTIALIVSIISTGCSGGNKEYRKCEGSIWSTTYHITYDNDRDLTDSIFEVMRKVEDSLSPFKRESLISSINRGETHQTDTLLRRIFKASQYVNRISGGVFDPTVSPLVNLWGFGYRNQESEPDSSDIAIALGRVGINRCRLAGDTLLTPDSTEFNFSAITKGYGCDLIGEMLKRNGSENYLVEIGGEMSLSGFNPRGEKWHVMIDAPIENDSTISHSRIAVIELSGGGVATSGNYRNYRNTKSQGKIWHTISPRTGYPARTTTLSATVIAENAMMADALATACMSMPTDSAMQMIEHLEKTEALLIEGDEGKFKFRISNGFPKMK